MSNILSEAVKQQLLKNEPYLFYFNFSDPLGAQQYQDFIETQEVTQYENVLANKMYGTELDFSDDIEKMQENMKRVLISAMNTLLSQENKMLTDISNYAKENDIKLPLKPSQPRAEDVINKFSNITTYQNDFNFYFQQLFLPVKLEKTKKGNNINWQNVKGDPNDYNYFLFLLSGISRAGGFVATKSRDLYFDKSQVFGDIKQLLDDDTTSNPTLDAINSNLDKYFEALRFGKGNSEIQSFEKDLKEQWKKKIQNKEKQSKKQWERDIFYTILMPPLIQELQKTKGLKEKAFPMKAITNRKNWDTFYNELIKTGFELSSFTFLEKESLGTGKFKGDFGEMVQAVLGQHIGIETKYMGDIAANEKVSSAQAFTDTLITVNGHSYGIQDKEYSWFVEKTRLYGENNMTINFSSKGQLTNFFSPEGIKILGSLIELYNNDSMDRARLETIFAHLDLEQLRTVGYIGVKPKPLKDISYDDFVYSLIYRVRGYYNPASYLLAQRINDIKEANPIYRFDDRHVARTSYKIQNIDVDKRNNMLTQRTIDNKGHTKLKKLDLETAEEFGKLLTLTAVAK